MLANVNSLGVLGIHATGVEVEADVAKGLPMFRIVGLPDTACLESQVRVRSAIKNSGFEFPLHKKIVINLAPAELKKEGSSYDLPIAMGILAATGQIDPESIASWIFVGELALDGKLRSISGILPRAVASAKRKQIFMFPEENWNEAVCVTKAKLCPAANLREAVEKIMRPFEAPVGREIPRLELVKGYDEDLMDVRGQMFARRGIEVACAGGHNLAMIGPPGSGKTMLAKRIPTLLPALNRDQALETTQIHSVAGKLKEKGQLILFPPFRAPHHTISDIALVGGGSYPRPGEISLAHHGVLFLDELPEFKRNALEVLRQPLEDGRVSIVRSAMSLTFPARFMMVAAMNPCPCGHYTDEHRECHCTPLQIKNYMGRISGPLMDRIDLHIEVGVLRPEDLDEDGPVPEDSEAVRCRVEKVRLAQYERYQDEEFSLNAHLGAKEVKKYCQMTAEARRFLSTALKEMNFSGRAYHKLLKLSLTIADMEGDNKIHTRHLQEAVHFRALDRTHWYQ